METNLLPCPFCGGEVFEPDFADGDCVYWIEHRKGCFLAAKEVSTFFDVNFPAWNKRYERTCRNEPPMSEERVRNGFLCTACGYEFGTRLNWGKFKWNYCPGCGSRIVNDD